jgi:D-alanyl-D-alanine endopeptidase (penicillin-binding protein 7)
MIKNKKALILLALFIFIMPLSVLAGNASLEIKYESQTFTEAVKLNISESQDKLNIPWEWEALTPAYNYSFVTTGMYDPSRPLEIKINYPNKNNNLKQIFVFDTIANVWHPILTKDFPKEQYVTAKTDSVSGKVIVLSNSDILTVGDASWYKYKNGLFAASPDFAKGTVLRVYNLENGKSVDVTINDFGPERDKHPTRVIDLDKVAFQKIASTGAGLVSIRIETLKVVNPTVQSKISQSSDIPNITASSAVVMMEKDGKIIFGKNETRQAPLASLTKLVAVRTFLDTRPTLSTVVTYKKQDENYNYKYCKPGESARLKVADGETMTMEDLVYSALVGSANNAVESLVRVSGLKREDFIAQMNKNVKAWGATNTRFVEPSGLSPDNVSSPLDYAIIVKEIFQSPVIQKISTAKKYSFKTINTKKAHTLTNTNQLLKNTAYTMLGSKTGYLDEAGYCLMTRVKTPQGNMIVVNFGSKGKTENFWDNEQLIRYGLRSLKVKK